MTNREALIALRDAVVAGKWDHSPNGVARKVFPYKSASIDDLGLTAVEAFNGSVDAAIALLEAVLPGWGWHVRQDPDGMCYGHCLYPKASRVSPGGSETNNPARALLIATLNALIAKEQE